MRKMKTKKKNSVEAAEPPKVAVLGVDLEGFWCGGEKMVMMNSGGRLRRRRCEIW